MKEYNSFVFDLKKLKNEYSASAEWKEKALHSINGLASERLRHLVSLQSRRKSGAFFTNSELGSAVLKSCKLTFSGIANFYDPACGASDFLISVKNHFDHKFRKKKIPLKVCGTDIHKEFVQASRLRLAISDLLKENFEDYTERILVADGLKHNEFYQRATHIVTNPPFNMMNSPTNISWASGKVSAAALFIDAISKNVNSGTEIIAILPDVLRSGSRYESWRALISTSCHVKAIKLFGQFDNYADVDVFSVLLKKKESPTQELSCPWKCLIDNKDSAKVSDLFNVSVGTVVDNRDPHEGTKRPYLKSRGLKGWTEVNQATLRRKHKGKAVESPFVVIKRTSRFGDKNRAIAILVQMPEPVFVDNHLIVLQPKKGGIASCKKIIQLLKSKPTDKWIDSQIRCRHLTVKVVSNIPI